MEPDIIPDSTENEQPKNLTNDRDFRWSAVLLAVIALLVYWTFSALGSYTVTPAERLGTVTGFLTLAFGSAVVFAIVLNVLLANGRKWWDVRGKLAGSNPRRPRAFGGKGAEGMKKEILSNNRWP